MMSVHDHIRGLEEKVASQADELEHQREAGEYRNRQLRACNLIVRCTGCWEGGPKNKDTITEADVVAVELIARRLRAWWDNMVWSRDNYPPRLAKAPEHWQQGGT